MTIFMTLNCVISRTSWRMMVSGGSFLWIFHALSLEPNVWRKGWNFTSIPLYRYTSPFWTYCEEEVWPNSWFWTAISQEPAGTWRSMTARFVGFFYAVIRAQFLREGLVFIPSPLYGYTFPFRTNFSVLLSHRVSFLYMILQLRKVLAM